MCAAGAEPHIYVEVLPPDDHALIRTMLVDLHLDEQIHYPDHPQLTRGQVEETLDGIPARFEGENVVLAVREGARVDGFCWCVLFDPGTGLEGEVAELFVAGDRRGGGIGEALVRRALELFRERRVTLGYVWTRSENAVAVRTYESAGFTPNRQLVLTWYPDSPR
ncbi:MAG: GNAT family N-acetyltransferase [Candidatus Dormibacterales bacterium]